MKVLDVIKNSNVLFFGDSITHNWEKYTHDLELTHPLEPNFQYGLGNGWVKRLNDLANFKNVCNVAVSGGCYASVEDIAPERGNFRHFVYQINHNIEEIKKADVIFVMFGTNDYSTQVKIGLYTDIAENENQKNMSFYAGINYGLSKIKEVNPQALVFVINILNRTYGIERDNFNFTRNDYNLAIKHACEMYHANLIDVSEIFKVPDNFPNGKLETYSDDGLHPNEKGNDVLTNFVANYEI